MVIALGCPLAAVASESRVRSTPAIPLRSSNRHYVTNRPPLALSPFVKLPIGSITPRGWLRGQLEREAAGMTGHLEEVSHWSRFEGNAWADPKGKGHSGWEEAPYWLKGYGDLGYVLKDERIIKEARRWIEAILSSQDQTGWFGPRELLTGVNGKPDLWPNMLALNVLQSYYEATRDERVLTFMTNYFRWERDAPAEGFLAGSWHTLRGGDNLESIYWLYNRTGEGWLLDVAKKVHQHTADWTRGVANWHGVNFTQGFREPAEFGMQSKDPAHLQATERDYDTMMARFGQVPGGGFGADENARPGYTDPRQGFETCSMVEFMHSAELLIRITGDPRWADRCEEMAFNSLPAALTPDQKALHYLTCPNQVRLDPADKSPGIQNGGNMFAYSPGEVFRCCQHNVAMGWPYYAEELWLATADDGLCASLYAASDVTARVGAGDGTPVTLSEATDYPFSDTIDLKVSTAKPVRFPLYLRVPRWSGTPRLTLNGVVEEVAARGNSYLVVDREWADGDRVRLQLPMRISVRTWEENKNSVSVDRGPLTFALRIGEIWERIGGTDAWPETAVLPSTPWNYGLLLDGTDPAASFEVDQQGSPLPKQPFTPEHAPITLKARAKQIPAWKVDEKGLVRELQPSPVRSTEPTETVTLIPMGCARLRISAFPVIGTGPDAHEWREPPPPPAASWCNPGDSTRALNDGKLPASSDDESIPRFTWWDHKGTEEWVQYDLPAPRTVSRASVYWFDDTGKGGCRVPASWSLRVRTGDVWKPVANPGPYGIERDAFNAVTFDPVKTDAIRLQVQLQKGSSGGILEWTVD